MSSNLTVPLDRRVWQEARTLREAGYAVSVICPKGGNHTKSYEVLEGIHVFRHPLPIEADGVLGYALEYGSALFWEFALSVRAAFKVGFDVVQACNPPDLMFLVAGFWKLLVRQAVRVRPPRHQPGAVRGEVQSQKAFHKLLLALERLTFKDGRRVDLHERHLQGNRRRPRRHGPDRVVVVRSIPDLSRFQRTEPDEALRNGRRHLIGYVGIMGAQDGVDLLIEAMAALVHGGGTARRAVRDRRLGDRDGEAAADDARSLRSRTT